jgi:hypothetical protein
MAWSAESQSVGINRIARKLGIGVGSVQRAAAKIAWKLGSILDGLAYEMGSGIFQSLDILVSALDRKLSPKAALSNEGHR